MEAVPLSSSSDRPSSSTSPSPSSPLITNDVFLNFRGEDTRKIFMGHLRDALSEKGIKTFIDDRQMKRGQFISPQLLQAIESSKCSVVILSPNYAFSTWCLDELVKILECMKTKGQIVIPIFYNVEPSDVRKQTGSFKEAIAKHERNLSENLERVNNWKTALKEVTDLAGFDLKYYSDEANFVKEIVDEVSRTLTSVASSRIVEDRRLVETWYSRFGTLFRSYAYSTSVVAIKIIFIFLVFFLVICPLFVLFCNKVLEPIVDHILGWDYKMPPW